MIPKIIHQILLPHHMTDNKNVWEKSAWMRATWKEKHPDWEYRLWTSTEELEGKLIAGDIYKANKNPAHKADILRYEILHAIGGIYADIDVACLRSFEPLLQGHGTAWVGGLSEKHYNPDPSDLTLFQTLEIAVLGAEQGHEFFKQLLVRMVKRRENMGSAFWGVPLCRRTGPFWFEKNLNEMGAAAKVTKLHGGYFYPTDFRHLDEFDAWVNMRHREAFCRHYWWGSWYKKNPDYDKLGQAVK